MKNNQSNEEVLYLKYRPKDFDEFVGNESTVESLKSVLERGNPPHAFLFYGPTGCGKTTLARIVKKYLGCGDRDFHEYNVANVRGIDTIREILNQMWYAPVGGRSKIYLLDECHALTRDAQNALLKALEDTPSHVYFILCTTEPQRLLQTIRNRCTPFEVSRLARPKMLRLLKRVSEAEGLNLDGRFLGQIATMSEGSPRAALVLLDGVKDLQDENDIEKFLQSQIPDEMKFQDLIHVLLDYRLSSPARWKEVSRFLSTTREDPEKLRRALMHYLAKVLLNQPNVQLARLLECLMSGDVRDAGWPGLVYCLFVGNFFAPQK